MKTRLAKAISTIDNSALRMTCGSILTSDYFFMWPASLSFHHAYEGGLAAHTLEVLDIAQRTVAAVFGDRIVPVGVSDVLTTACIWHDYMKVAEYQVVTVVESDPAPDERHLQFYRDGGRTDYFVGTAYPKFIGHITGSAIEFAGQAVKYGVLPNVIDAVVHCIVSHHGPVREWGSPVAPQSLEAWVLHQADMLSAKFGATKDQRL